MKNRENGWQYSDEPILAEAVKEEFDSCIPPPVDEAWAALATRLDIPTKNPGKKHERLLRKPLTWGLVAGLVFGFVWLSMSDYSEAVGQRFLRFFLHQKESTIISSNSLTRSRDAELSLNKPDKAGFADSVNTRDVTIEEARQMVPFPLHQPAYLPAGYHLSRITVVNRGENDVDVILRYVSGRKELTLMEVHTPGEAGSGVAFDVDDTTRKRVVIQGNQGIILSAKDGTSRLTWTDRMVTYTLSGPLPGDELIKIGNALLAE